MRIATSVIAWQLVVSSVTADNGGVLGYEPATGDGSGTVKPTISECIFNTDCMGDQVCCKTGFCCSVAQFKYHLINCSVITTSAGCGPSGGGGGSGGGGSLVCCAADHKCHFAHDCPSHANYIRSSARLWQEKYRKLLTEELDHVEEEVGHAAGLFAFLWTVLVVLLLAAVVASLVWCVYKVKTNYAGRANYDYMGSGGSVLEKRYSEQMPTFTYTPYQFADTATSAEE